MESSRDNRIKVQRKKNSFKRYSKNNRKHRFSLKLLVLAFFLMSSITFLAITLTFRFVKVVGHGMMPNLVADEILMVSKKGTLKRFDLVYLEMPTNPKKQVIRRVIGLPNEELAIKNDELFINQQAVPESYLNQRKNQLGGILLTADFTLQGALNQEIVPENSYFVLGDNRQSASDSREFGFVKASSIKGKVILKIWPLDKIEGY